MACLRPLDRAAHRGGIVARQMAHAADPSLVPGTQAFLRKSKNITAANSPELVQRAHDWSTHRGSLATKLASIFLLSSLPSSSRLFSRSASRESARFNSTIVRHQRCPSSLRDRAPAANLSTPRTGGAIGTRSRLNGFAGVGSAAAYIFFAYIGFDAVSTTAQEAKNPQRDLPIGIIVSLFICTLLYIAALESSQAWCLGRMSTSKRPLRAAFLDRGQTTASHVITIGALGRSYQRYARHAARQTRVFIRWQ